MKGTGVKCDVSVLVIIVTIAVATDQASVGTPIVYRCTDKGPANFSFSLPANIDEKQVTLVANPSGKEVFFVFNAFQYDISTYYRDRIVGVQFENRRITFSLQNVTPDDAGDYSCKKYDFGGEVIPDCGQTLHYIGPQSATSVSHCRGDYFNISMPPSSFGSSYSSPHSSPPIVHCRGDHSPAHFNISMPPSSFGLTNLIVHPSGKVFISREKHYFPRRDMEFAHRIHSLERHGDSVSFSLINVHREDAGEYVCREGSVTGRQIRGCVQRLYYIDLDQPYVRHSRLPVDGEELRLGCEVYVPDQTAELGLNFCFHWSRDGQPISGQHDRVLAFHPVSWSDRGRYSCRVKENTRGCGSSPESNAFSLNPIVPPIVSLRRHQHRPSIEVQAGHHMTLTCEVKAAFPPVPPNGFTWTFTSDSSPARQLPLTGDTLTLGPVTREDSGQYTCQVRNDQDLPHSWRHGEDIVMLNVIMDTESSPLPPDRQSRKGEVSPSTLLPVSDSSLQDWEKVSMNESVEEQAIDGLSINAKSAASMEVNALAVWAMLCSTWAAIVIFID